MTNKKLIIDFINYAKARHIMPILHSNIEPLAEDYLHHQNLPQYIVSGITPRNYKFRGKSNGDIDTWIYGYYHFDNRTNLHYICDSESLIRYEVKSETVGQLLVIHNGVEYYEKDVVQDWSGIRELKFEIFDDEQGCFLRLDDNNLRVLGNIFDNPGLLG